MGWMEKKFGVPFPFKAYRILTAPGIGGAMENVRSVTCSLRTLTCGSQITLTTFDQKFLNDAKSYVLRMCAHVAF